MRIRALHLLPLLLALVAGLALPGCGSSKKFIQGTEIDVPEFDSLWERSRDVLIRAAYRIDTVETQRSEKELISTWKVRLDPMRFKGKRRRVTVRFEKIGEGRYRTDVAVQQERNSEITDPLNPLAANWEDDDDADTKSLAEVIQYNIESLFIEQELEEGKPTDLPGIRTAN